MICTGALTVVYKKKAFYRNIDIGHMQVAKKEGIRLWMILPLLIQLLALMFQWCQTGGSPFTHSGSSDSHGAQTDGGKNKQLRLNFVNVLLQSECLFPPFSYLFLLSSCSSVFCSVLCHLDVRFNSVTYGVLRDISPRLSWQSGFAGLCMSMCKPKIRFVCVSECGLFPLSFSASRFPSCHTLTCQSSINVQLSQLCQELFSCTFSASVCLKCCLFYLADRFVHGRTTKTVCLPN